MNFSFTLKPGVDARKCTPQNVLGILIASQVFEKNGIPFVVTSISDGKHGKNSLHYEGNAFDCRLPSRHTGQASDNEAMKHSLALALGEQWDVVLESDHLHIEWDV